LARRCAKKLRHSVWRSNRIGSFIIPIVCVILSIIGIIGWWSVIAGLFAGWFLYKVTLEGAADAIKYGAAQSEPLYQALVCRGAFLFDPPAGAAV
jgi:hypothetical protein